ncbi:GtrA family protein [Paractinoplanes maris]|uniref:GtrA family protein n=1 Tax=Paractinoplanes maris TaxID=1734446 RepID=UPI002021317A|nr:GtrA family protein [Actinoplanes maris]
MPSAEASRLLRYGLSGAASALTHLSVGLLLAEGLEVPPVTASATGFAASVLVSYGLQRSWVFRASTGHVTTGGRFLAVTAVAFALNTAILGLVTGPYLMVQALALVTIPAVNYALNSRWTFRAR